MVDYHFPKNKSQDSIESFNDFANDKIVIALYDNHYYGERWALVYGVVNRKTGEYPYLVGLAAGHFTSFYLVYADSEEEALDILADEAPQLIQCNEDDYHEDDIYHLGNESIPVFSETIRACVRAKRVNYRANYWHLFEGEYTFPKDRKGKS